ncbi:MAG: PAS domain S-box protein [Ginsengibacter sp.]
MSSLSFDSHFRDLFENGSDLIHFASMEGEVKLVNPAWLKILEYKAEEVLGRSLFEFIHPAYVESFRTYRHNSIRQLESEITETAFQTKSGRKVIVEGRLGVSFENDQPAHTRGVFKDITFRHLAQKKLEESEKRLQTFFQNAPDAVIVINEQQSILEWNPKAEIIFGFREEEVLGKKLSETIIPQQYRKAHSAGMVHFLATGEGPVLNKTIEITALHKNGTEFYIDLSISSVKLEDHWMFIAFISDISERKKTEESLIRREAELLQSKLHNEKKDDFISIASHELKTPLTTIKAYTQLALSYYGQSPEKVIDYLKKIDEYTVKLNTLINELLDVSKLHAGKLKLVTQLTNVGSFISETIGSLQQITPGHSLVIEENVSVGVNIDVLRLEQVLANLISNASKYSPGESRIIIRSFKKDDHIIIGITDFGIGISKDKLENVFTRFYRVDENEKQFGGLGIGLFISSEIIKQHGGEIWVESIPGKGSTFYFSLPVVEVAGRRI